MAVRLSGGVRVTGEQAKTGPYKEFGLFSCRHEKPLQVSGQEGTRAGLGWGRPSSRRVVVMAVGRHLRKQLNSG